MRNKDPWFSWSFWTFERYRWVEVIRLNEQLRCPCIFYWWISTWCFKYFLNIIRRCWLLLNLVVRSINISHTASSFTRIKFRFSHAFIKCFVNYIVIGLRNRQEVFFNLFNLLLLFNDQVWCLNLTFYQFLLYVFLLILVQHLLNWCFLMYLRFVVYLFW